MKFLSVFSGVEAFSLAVRGLDYQPVGFSEIDPFACAVLAHRFPEVPNFGDVRNISKDTLGMGGDRLDLLVGGSPCQSFSIAGRREGLAGESGLVREYLRILEELQPRWFLWENVPGALSSERGRAFGLILREMGERGYALAWRILDARYFGVPQRRRRVYVVGRLGADSDGPAKVLLEPESMRGNPSPCGEEGQGTAGGAESRVGKSSGSELIPIDLRNVTRDPLKKDGTGVGIAEDGAPAFTMTGSPQAVADCHGSHWDSPANPHPTLNQSAKGSGGIGMSNQELFSQRGGGLVEGRERRIWPAKIASTLDTLFGTKMGLDNQHVRQGCPLFVPARRAEEPTAEREETPREYAVRRLTPRECERLQGFPDDWTDVPYHGREHAPDTQRYKVIGNSFAVPVIRWIAKRILEADHD